MGGEILAACLFLAALACAFVGILLTFSRMLEELIGIREEQDRFRADLREAIAEAIIEIANGAADGFLVGEGPVDPMPPPPSDYPPGYHGPPFVCTEHPVLN
jgi:hypothetical protein